MADTRTPNEKRADNLKDLINRGLKDPRTLNESSKRLLDKDKPKAEADTRPADRNEVIETAFGPVKPGQTPFEQLQRGKGDFYESAKRGYEGVVATDQYNPQGLSNAFSGPPEEFASRYREAHGKAIQSKMEFQNINLFQQSALADMTQAGLFVSVADITGYGGDGKPTYGSPYLRLSDKGKNLGEERIFEVEEGATWGDYFDFVFKDDIVYMYPEGTRKASKSAGFDEPFLLEKGGDTYLVVQKSGKDTITVMPFDTKRNVLGVPVAKDVTDFLDMSEYDISPDASFEFELSDSGFDVKASGVTRKQAAALSEEYPDGWKESATSDPWKDVGVTPPWKEGAVVYKDAKFSYSGGRYSYANDGSPVSYSPFELTSGKFLTEIGVEFDPATQAVNPMGIPYNPQDKRQYAMYGASTPIREFFWADFSKGAKEWASGVESKYLPDVKADFGPVEVRPSDVIGYGVSIPEMLAKGTAAPIAVGVGLAARAKMLPYTEEQEDIAAGTAMAATFKGLIYTPGAVTTFMTIKGESDLANRMLKAEPATMRASLPRGSSLSIDDAGNIVESYRSGTPESIIPKGHPIYKSLYPKASLGAVKSDVSAVINGIPGANLAKGTLTLGVESAQRGVSYGTFMGGTQTVMEFAMGNNPLDNPESQKRIATAGVLGIGIGFGSKSLGGVGAAFVKKASELPGKMTSEAWKIPQGVGDTVAPAFNMAGDKVLQAGGSMQRFFSVPKAASTPKITPIVAPYIPQEITDRKAAFSQTLRLNIRAEERQRFYTEDAQKPKANPILSAFAFNIRASEGSPGVLQRDAVSLREEIAQDAITREAGRTRAEQFAIIREVGATGQRARTRQADGVGVRDSGATTQSVWVGVTPRLGQGFKFRFGETLKPPRQPMIPLPPIRLPQFSDGAMKPPRMPKARNAKGGYSPSLAGADLGISEKKIKKMYLGFEIRGLRKKNVVL